MTIFNWVVTIAFVLFGVAMLLHIRKEATDAHGKNRK